MQSNIDFVCSDCNESFENASLLLKHFALHVSLTTTTTTDGHSSEKATKRKKSPIPDLYPIRSRRIPKKEIEDSVDSGFEDVNPMRFCQVTMEEKRNETKTGESEKVTRVKRYNCEYCSRAFGWCTDLKRHLLTHTGERPFRCEQCKMGFTRNFLLQKHRLKYHEDEEDEDVLFNVTKMSIPSLRPLEISSSVKHKPRKQDKCKIKRKVCSTKVMYQSNVKNLIFSI